MIPCLPAISVLSLSNYGSLIAWRRRVGAEGYVVKKLPRNDVDHVNKNIYFHNNSLEQHKSKYRRPKLVN